MPPITLNLFDWELTHLNNFVSDTTLGLISIFCSYLLARLLEDRFIKHRFWRLFFLSLGVSALIGGVGHALTNYAISIYLLLVSWALNLVAILFLERAVIEQLRSETLRKWLIVIVYVKLIATLVFLLIQQKYLVVAISSAFGIIGFLMPVVIFRIRKHTEVSVNWFVAGFIFSLLGGVAFALKWDASRWLQHADLGHYLIAGSMICFYKGVAWLYAEDKLYPAREEVWF